MMHRSTRLAAALVLLVSVFSSAASVVRAAGDSDKSSGASPVAAQPSATTASFGDWTMRCERPAEAGPAKSVCDVAQSIQTEGHGVVAQLSLLKAEGKGASDLRAIVLVPSNILFAEAVRISADAEGMTPLELAWHSCMPIGCVADVVVPAAHLAKWRAASGRGRITYKDAGGRDVEVPVSFRGLEQALDALEQQK